MPGRAKWQSHEAVESPQPQGLSSYRVGGEEVWDGHRAQDVEEGLLIHARPVPRVHGQGIVNSIPSRRGPRLRAWRAACTSGNLAGGEAWTTTDAPDSCGSYVSADKREGEKRKGREKGRDVPWVAMNLTSVEALAARLAAA
jgi:hypothetical protein